MERNKIRYIEYDVLRILACICVIMIHAPVFDQGAAYANNTLAFQAINVWGTVGRWAVPVFVMLSGMLILPCGDEVSIKKLMLRRVLRMFGTYIAWSVVYSTYNVFVLKRIYAETEFKTWVDGFFSGEMHMWYLPMLGGLYIVSPILSQMVKRIEKRWIVYWIVGMFLFSSVIPFIENRGIKYISVIIGSVNGYTDLQFLGGWTLYYVLGYYIGNHSFSRKERNIAYVVGMAAFLFTFYGTIVHSVIFGSTMGILAYYNPNIMLFSISVLIFAKEELPKCFLLQKYGKHISALSKLTFGIYLIHLLLLEVWYSLGVNIAMFHPIASIPMVAFIVFASGAIIVSVLRRIPVFGKYFA